MSRVGKNPIVIPSGVEARYADGQITVKGPKGELIKEVHSLVRVEIVDSETGKEIRVSVAQPEEKRERALWGTFRSLIANMVTGVTEGFEKKLEVQGVGYKVSVSGSTLTLNVGFSHSVPIELPKGVTASVEKNVIIISGIDKQMVGQVAASIRKIRKPEPYKGKGVRYVDEQVRRKAGKAAKAAAA